MNKFAIGIEKRLLGREKRTPPIKHFHQIVMFLVKKGGYSVGDLMDMPTPMVLGLFEELDRYYKEKNKAIKKANKR